MLSFVRLSLLSLTFASTVLANIGQATYYAPGLGACGLYNTGNDMIVAVASQFYDTYPGATPNPNLNPVCGKAMTVSYAGKSIIVTVADKCPGCQGLYDLDLSPAAFNLLGDPLLGRLFGVEWSFIGQKEGPFNGTTRSTHEAREDSIAGVKMVGRR